MFSFPVLLAHHRLIVNPINIEKRLHLLLHITRLNKFIQITCRDNLLKITTPHSFNVTICGLLKKYVTTEYSSGKKVYAINLNGLVEFVRTENKRILLFLSKDSIRLHLTGA